MGQAHTRAWRPDFLQELLHNMQCWNKVLQGLPTPAVADMLCCMEVLLIVTLLDAAFVL